MFPRRISGVNPNLVYPLPLFYLSRAAFPDGIALESAMVSPTLLGQVCEHVWGLSPPCWARCVNMCGVLVHLTGPGVGTCVES